MYCRLFLPIRFPILCRHDCTCQEAQIAFDKRQLDQPEVVERQFLVACRNGTTLFQPAHALLDGTAPAILLTVIRHWTATFALPSAPFGRNDRRNPTRPQEVADAHRVISAVGCQATWAPPSPSACAGDGHLLQYRFDLGRFVSLPRRETGIERDAVAVTEQMDFGAEAAHRAAKRVVSGFGAAIRPALFRASGGTMRTDDRAIQ